MLNEITNDIERLTSMRQHIQVVHAGRNIDGQIKAIDHIIDIQNHLNKLKDILEKELNEKDKYTLLSNGDGSFSINDVVINQKVFYAELVNYRVANKNDLIESIQEYTKEANESDLVLMRDDIAYLQSIPTDELCFSSILTNEYIFFSEQPDRFNEICEEILDENSIL